MLVTLRGQRVNCGGSHSNNFIPGSFYLLFFILSAANVILVTSSSVK